MDNGPAENAIRPVAVGRKGWLFSDTVEGAETTAMLYSIVETAKANGKDPHAYLTMVIDRLPHAKTLADVEALKVRLQIADTPVREERQCQQKSAN